MNNKLSGRRAVFGALGAAAIGITFSHTAAATTPGPVYGAVETIAGLKALTPPTTVGALVFVNGYHAANDGGGGWFRMETSGAEDGGLCFISDDETVYWHRVVLSDELDVRWFGVQLGDVGDTVAEANTLAVKAAGLAVQTAPQAFGVCVFPRGQLKLRIIEAHLTKINACWSLIKLSKDGVHFRLDGTELDIFTTVNDATNVQTLFHLGYYVDETIHGFRLSGGFIRMQTAGGWRTGKAQDNYWQVVTGVAHDSSIENLQADGVPRLGEMVAREVEGRKISRNVIRNVSFLDYGGAGRDVWLRISGATLVEHCYLTSRNAECSHGIYTAPERDIVIRDCVFDNVAKTVDGGEKHAISYRAAGSEDYGPLVISGCTFRNSGPPHLGYTQGTTVHDIKLSDCHFDGTELWIYHVDKLVIANCSFGLDSKVRVIDSTHIHITGVTLQSWLETQRCSHLKIDITIEATGGYITGGPPITELAPAVPTTDLSLTVRGSDLTDNNGHVKTYHGLTRAYIHADLSGSSSKLVNLHGPLERVTVTGLLSTTATATTEFVKVTSSPTEVEDLVLRSLDCYGGPVAASVTTFASAILRGCRLQGADVADQN